MNNQLTLEIIILTLKRISQGSPDYLLAGFNGSNYGLCAVVLDVVLCNSSGGETLLNVVEAVMKDFFYENYGDTTYPLGRENFYNKPKWFGEEGVKRRKLAGELAEYLEQCKEEILTNSEE
jgi:hypothetical protein